MSDLDDQLNDLTTLNSVNSDQWKSSEQDEEPDEPEPERQPRLRRRRSTPESESPPPPSLEPADSQEEQPRRRRRSSEQAEPDDAQDTPATTPRRRRSSEQADAQDDSDDAPTSPTSPRRNLPVMPAIPSRVIVGISCGLVLVIGIFGISSFFKNNLPDRIDRLRERDPFIVLDRQPDTTRVEHNLRIEQIREIVTSAREVSPISYELSLEDRVTLETMLSWEYVNDTTSVSHLENGDKLFRRGSEVIYMYNTEE